LGGFAFATFFLVVAVLLPGTGLGWTYLAASATALVLNSIALRFIPSRQIPLTSGV
jgi:hypothetical protein